jgi:anti-sigma factor RsiW
MIEDADLIALIDGELDEARAGELRERLTADANLRARYEALCRQGPAIGAAFASLLPQAPVERLTAFIPPEATRRRPPSLALRQLAAGLVIGFALAAGLMAFVFSQKNADDDWRESVLDYMALYTNETFARIPASREARAMELEAVGERVGEKLSPEGVALPGLDLRTAFILAYEGKPLAEVVQTDRSGAPVLFCVIANGEADAPLAARRKDGFSLASWSRGGKGFLVIAGLPQSEVEAYAKSLQTRF